MEGAAMRIRPVFMTVCAIIMGLLPFLWGTDGRWDDFDDRIEFARGSGHLLPVEEPRGYETHRRRNGIIHKGRGDCSATPVPHKCLCSNR